MSRFCLAGLVLSMLTAVACAPVDASESDDDDEQQPGDEVPSSGLTCVELFDCVGQCGDQACADDCAGKASKAGLDTASAVATCIDASGCADDACIETSCGTELAACIEQGKADPGVDVPPGSVPAELVGSWAGADYGTTRRLVLGADGSAAWSVADATELGSCLRIETISYYGTAVFTDKDFTFHGQSAVWTVSECSKKVEEKPDAVKSWTSPYVLLDASTMRVTDLSNCPPEYDEYNQAVYCSATITRE